MCGLTRPELPRIRGCLLQDMKQKPGRTAFLPAWVTWDQDRWKIEPLRWKGSADIIGFSRANATVIFPGDRDSLHSGDQVEAMLLPDYSLRSRNPLAGGCGVKLVSWCLGGESGETVHHQDTKTPGILRGSGCGWAEGEVAPGEAVSYRFRRQGDGRCESEEHHRSACGRRVLCEAVARDARIALDSLY